MRRCGERKRGSGSQKVTRENLAFDERMSDLTRNGIFTILSEGKSNNDNIYDLDMGSRSCGTTMHTIKTQKLICSRITLQPDKNLIYPFVDPGMFGCRPL